MVSQTAEAGDGDFVAESLATFGAKSLRDGVSTAGMYSLRSDNMADRILYGQRVH